MVNGIQTVQLVKIMASYNLRTERVSSFIFYIKKHEFDTLTADARQSCSHFFRLFGNITVFPSMFYFTLLVQLCARHDYISESERSKD